MSCVWMSERLKHSGLAAWLWHTHHMADAAVDIQIRPNQAGDCDEFRHTSLGTEPAAGYRVVPIISGEARSDLNPPPVGRSS
jgi:hypothetical protein